MSIKAAFLIPLSLFLSSCSDSIYEYPFEFRTVPLKGGGSVGVYTFPDMPSMNTSEAGLSTSTELATLLLYRGSYNPFPTFDCSVFVNGLKKAQFSSQRRMVLVIPEGTTRVGATMRNNLAEAIEWGAHKSGIEFVALAGRTYSVEILQRGGGGCKSLPKSVHRSLATSASYPLIE